MNKIVEKQAVTFRTPLAVPVQSVGDSLPYDTLEVRVAYRKYPTRKGFDVIVKPVRVSGGIISCTYGSDRLVNGFTIRGAEVSRFSAKELTRTADKVGEVVERVAELYSQRNLADAHETITTALDLPSWRERKVG